MEDIVRRVFAAKPVEDETLWVALVPGKITILVIEKGFHLVL
jgi:hypothetical protein